MASISMFGTSKSNLALLPRCYIVGLRCVTLRCVALRYVKEPLFTTAHPLCRILPQWKQVLDAMFVNSNQLWNIAGLCLLARFVPIFFLRTCIGQGPTFHIIDRLGLVIFCYILVWVRIFGPVKTSSSRLRFHDIFFPERCCSPVHIGLWGSLKL